MSGPAAQSVLDRGLDFVMIGRAAILQSDCPGRVRENPLHASPPTPVTKEHLRQQGLSETFIRHLTKWNGFVR